MRPSGRFVARYVSLASLSLRGSPCSPAMVGARRFYRETRAQRRMPLHRHRSQCVRLCAHQHTWHSANTARSLSGCGCAFVASRAVAARVRCARKRRGPTRSRRSLRADVQRALRSRAATQTARARNGIHLPCRARPKPSLRAGVRARVGDARSGSCRFQRPVRPTAAGCACSSYETIQKPRSNTNSGCNFRILREQQQRTQSLLTVMGPLEQDVAVQRSSDAISNVRRGTACRVGRHGHSVATGFQ